jgi:hypothetical protein
MAATFRSGRRSSTWALRRVLLVAMIAPAGKPTVSPAQAPVDVEAVLTKLASQNKEKLEWRTSIVDLMKLLDLDSSFAARKELAHELHYTGSTSDSAGQ